MPDYWHSRRACFHKFKDNEDELQFQLRICADKKPYFMMYIYPSLGKLVRKYEASVKFAAQQKFQQDYELLMEKDADELTEEEAGFVISADHNAPVNYGACTMNRLCWMVEDQFPRTATRQPKSEFDQSLVVDADFDIKQANKNFLKRLGDIVREYAILIQQGMQTSGDFDESNTNWFRATFERQLSMLSDDVRLVSNILAEKYYDKEWVRGMIWGRCPWTLLPAIAAKSETAYAPVACADGEIAYIGERYTMKPIEVIIPDFRTSGVWEGAD